jgi:hypothetical protein
LIFTYFVRSGAATGSARASANFPPIPFESTRPAAEAAETAPINLLLVIIFVPFCFKSNFDLNTAPQHSFKQLAHRNVRSKYFLVAKPSEKEIIALRAGRLAIPLTSRVLSFSGPQTAPALAVLGK